MLHCRNQCLSCVSTLSTCCVHRVAEYQLQLVSEAGFSQADEQSSQAALQQLRQSHVSDKSLQSMAELLCSSPQQQQTGTNGSLWDAAVKPFVPLPLASLQPKIKVSMHRAHAAYLHCHAHALLLDCIKCCIQVLLHSSLASTRLLACKQAMQVLTQQ